MKIIIVLMILTLLIGCTAIKICVSSLTGDSNGTTNPTTADYTSNAGSNAVATKATGTTSINAVINNSTTVNPKTDVSVVP